MHPQWCGSAFIVLKLRARRTITTRNEASNKPSRTNIYGSVTKMSEPTNGRIERRWILENRDPEPEFDVKAKLHYSRQHDTACELKQKSVTLWENLSRLHKRRADWCGTAYVLLVASYFPHPRVAYDNIFSITLYFKPLLHYMFRQISSWQGASKLITCILEVPGSNRGADRNYTDWIRFEDSTAVTMENTVFWDIELRPYLTEDTLRLSYRSSPVSVM
jgi:hypothetical protein